MNSNALKSINQAISSMFSYFQHVAARRVFRNMVHTKVKTVISSIFPLVPTYFCEFRKVER